MFTSSFFLSSRVCVCFFVLIKINDRAFESLLTQDDSVTLFSFYFSWYVKKENKICLLLDVLNQIPFEFRLYVKVFAQGRVTCSGYADTRMASVGGSHMSFASLGSYSPEPSPPRPQPTPIPPTSTLPTPTPTPASNSTNKVTGNGPTIEKKGDAGWETLRSVFAP